MLWQLKRRSGRPELMKGHRRGGRSAVRAWSSWRMSAGEGEAGALLDRSEPPSLWGKPAIFATGASWQVAL